MNVTHNDIFFALCVKHIILNGVQYNAGGKRRVTKFVHEQLCLLNFKLKARQWRLQMRSPKSTVLNIIITCRLFFLLGCDFQQQTPFHNNSDICILTVNTLTYLKVHSNLFNLLKSKCSSAQSWKHCLKYSVSLFRITTATGIRKLSVHFLQDVAALCSPVLSSGEGLDVSMVWV